MEQNDIRGVLKRYWGFDRFRPLQEEVIRTVLANRDALVLMPTGGGKSLIYQVPTLAREGLCVVVTPLIALMKDQVDRLRARGIGSPSMPDCRPGRSTWRWTTAPTTRR